MFQLVTCRAGPVLTCGVSYQKSWERFTRIPNIVIIVDQQKGQGCIKRGREEVAHYQVSITIRQTQKPLTLNQISSSFMTL